MKPEPWMTIYPTVAAVREAHFDTLIAWWDHLPPPQTDVEHTVRRRIRLSMDTHIANESPNLFASMEKLRDSLAKAGFNLPGNLFTRD